MEAADQIVPPGNLSESVECLLQKIRSLYGELRSYPVFLEYHAKELRMLREDIDNMSMVGFALNGLLSGFRVYDLYAVSEVEINAWMSARQISSETQSEFWGAFEKLDFGKEVDSDNEDDEVMDYFFAGKVEEFLAKLSSIAFVTLIREDTDLFAKIREAIERCRKWQKFYSWVDDIIVYQRLVLNLPLPAVFKEEMGYLAKYLISPKADPVAENSEPTWMVFQKIAKTPEVSAAVDGVVLGWNIPDFPFLDKGIAATRQFIINNRELFTESTMRLRELYELLIAKIARYVTIAAEHKCLLGELRAKQLLYYFATLLNPQYFINEIQLIFSCTHLPKHDWELAELFPLQKDSEALTDYCAPMQLLKLAVVARFAHETPMQSALKFAEKYSYTQQLRFFGSSDNYPKRMAEVRDDDLAFPGINRLHGLLDDLKPNEELFAAAMALNNVLLAFLIVFWGKSMHPYAKPNREVIKESEFTKLQEYFQALAETDIGLCVQYYLDAKFYDDLPLIFICRYYLLANATVAQLLTSSISENDLNVMRKLWTNHLYKCANKNAFNNYLSALDAIMKQASVKEGQNFWIISLLANIANPKSVIALRFRQEALHFKHAFLDVGEYEAESGLYQCRELSLLPVFEKHFPISDRTESGFSVRLWVNEPAIAELTYYFVRNTNTDDFMIDENEDLLSYPLYPPKPAEIEHEVSTSLGLGTR